MTVSETPGSVIEIGPQILCLDCQSSFPESGPDSDPDPGFPYICPHCGGLFDFVDPLEYAPVRGAPERGARERSSRSQSIWQYRKTFPIVSNGEFVTLGEGNTPLVSHDMHGKEIYFKCEYLNPTGSFKDRGSAVLVSALVARGIERAADDSSGNAGSSFAAYAARAGIDAEIYVPSYASGPKLNQMEAYGAQIISISGPRSAASDAVLKAVKAGVTYASHAYLPHGIAGMATTAFEIVEQLGKAPGSVIVPVGQGTMIIGLGRGFAALMHAGLIDKLPRLVAVQARACAPIWMLISGEATSLDQVSEGETVAEGIRIKAPLRTEAIIRQIQKSDGMAVAVEENEIVPGREALARLGLYIEPTSSVVWPALNSTLDELEEPVVVILTGSGLKSPVGL